MESKSKSFDQLVKEKASCQEFAWNGFIRIYEEGEKQCECEQCQLIKKWNENLDKCKTSMKIENGCLIKK